MTQATLQARKEQSKPVKHNISITVIHQPGVRGICGHIAKSADSYCGNPRCCPWAW